MKYQGLEFSSIGNTEFSCINCDSKLYVTNKSDIKFEREKIKQNLKNKKDQYDLRQIQIEEKISKLSASGKLTEEMSVMVGFKLDCSNLLWLSEDEFKKKIKPVRTTLPLPFSLEDNDIISNAVDWYIRDETNITKRRSHQRFFYPVSADILDGECEIINNGAQTIPKYSSYYQMNSDYPNFQFNFYMSWEVKDAYPPDVLVGYPPLPMNIEYETNREKKDLCFRIWKQNNDTIFTKIEEYKEERIMNEKSKLVNISNDLALFAQKKCCKKITNQLVNDFLKEKNIQFIWKDSRDIVRIRSGLILKGMR